MNLLLLFCTNSLFSAISVIGFAFSKVAAFTKESKLHQVGKQTDC